MRHCWDTGLNLPLPCVCVRKLGTGNHAQRHATRLLCRRFCCSLLLKHETTNRCIKHATDATKTTRNNAQTGRDGTGRDWTGRDGTRRASPGRARMGRDQTGLPSSSCDASEHLSRRDHNLGAIIFGADLNSELLLAVGFRGKSVATGRRRRRTMYLYYYDGTVLFVCLSVTNLLQLHRQVRYARQRHATQCNGSHAHAMYTRSPSASFHVHSRYTAAAAAAEQSSSGACAGPPLVSQSSPILLLRCE